VKLIDAINQLRIELSDLADPQTMEGKRYSNSFLTKGINNGLQIAFSLRKDLFNKVIIQEATIGDLQIASGLDTISKVDGITDACGNIKKKLNKSIIGIADIYPKRKCTVGATPIDECKTPDTYVISKSGGNSFSFDPPVLSEGVFYRVQGFVMPPPYTCDLNSVSCVPPHVHIAAMHYAKYFAFLTETESVSSRTLAQDNLNAFFLILKIVKQEDKLYCKEFCK
jgi:hypothetical protein